MNTTWDVKSLKDLDTIHQGQCCNCKIDTGDIRVWICRVAGGVTIEQYQDGKWIKISGSCNGSMR